LLQAGTDNDNLLSLIKCNWTECPESDTSGLIFSRDATAKQDFVQIKDFYANLVKALTPAID
jgi:hypothetical protein